jgi:hypothetical protein
LTPPASLPQARASPASRHSTDTIVEHYRRLESLLESSRDAIREDLRGIAARLDALERLDRARPAPGDDPRPGGVKPSPGALLKRLKRGDLRQDDDPERPAGEAAAACSARGCLPSLWASLLGIRGPDQRNGIEGSRLIHPTSPFFTCERPRPLAPPLFTRSLPRL